ncbi:AAA family ATPase [Ramlibacter sp. WS9]|uniref:AAA family ATPase n=1 Tax=Ramlibacter sp. WS9 TaxID=1882741 RepID=UPI0011412263|nr:ATP-binding protein [Ramlibacter sp. WS9]ROZ64425.1 chromosome segregation protein SMC [Ramlibacter sp. WS9]
MRIHSIKIRNWKNFTDADVSLSSRTFIVGANASGKSNFLDIFRFLRDVANSSGGGLQKALKDRGGMSKVRSLAARRDPNILLDLKFTEDGDSICWRYVLEISQETAGKRRPVVKREVVYGDNPDTPLLDRPTPEDRQDPERLTQTNLEQVNSNHEFRPIADFFGKTVYLHLVPQLLKYAEGLSGHYLENDPFGQGFLDRIASATERRRKKRLTKIQEVLKKAVPQLEELQFERDPSNGKPHLKAKYAHWRVNGAWQREEQFSDGTLRLIGLFWVLQEDPGLLLLEEPELSLNAKIVSFLAPFIYKLQGKGQVLVTTHSHDLLADEGISLDEVVLLEPSTDATKIRPAKDLTDVVALVEGGLSLGPAILPHAAPPEIDSLASV